MTRLSRAAALALAALALAAGTPGAAATIDYLYVDASEGGGSGGHAALVFGDRVFHFEHRAPGLLRLARESFEDARHRYSVLDNRTIVLSRIAASEETHDLILEEFTRRYLVQNQHLQDHRGLVDDRRLFELALAQRRHLRGGEALLLEGAGFFFDLAAVPAEPGVALSTALSTPAPEAPALARLRQRMEATYGEDFLGRLTERIRDELGGLAPDLHRDAPAPLSADRFAAGSSGFAQRYRDGVLALLALDVLGLARPLRPGSTADDGGGGPALEGDDAEVLERLAGALESSLVRLVQSRRPDWGFPLLIGMARLIALDETLQKGRWVLLDAWSDEAPAIARERPLRDPAFARGVVERASADFESARAHLRQSASSPERFPEADYTELETAGNRLVAVARSLRERRDPGPGRGARPPARGALHRDPYLPALGTDALERALEVAREREATHAAALKRLYGYNLFTRNCVTEILRTIEAALARDVLARQPGLAGAALATQIEDAAAERLGGHVDPDGSLNFIPAVSAISVRERYAVSEVVEIPSYRKSELARMYRRELPLQVFLRESNTLTSTLYRKGPEDSAFLFFTDDVIAPRPVYGALNLITGLGVAAAGLVMLPVDHGATLWSGLRGALFSLPELAFFNIRKGSFDSLGPRAPAAPRRRLSREMNRVGRSPWSSAGAY